MLLVFEQSLCLGDANPLVSIGLLKKFLFGGLVEVEEDEGVLDEVEFDPIVEGSVSCETGSVVDFNDDGLEHFVDHDIDAQDVEAHVAILIIGLGELVLMAHQRLPKHYRLDEDVIDSFLEALHIETVFTDILQHRAHRPFVARRHVLSALVEYEVRVLLIDGVVREVHAHFLEVILIRLDVGLGGQASQSLLVNVQPHWIGPTQQYVNSEIKFKAI